jgi:antitoxin CptB
VSEGTESDHGHRKNQGIDGAAGDLMDDGNGLIGERALSKLKWRCRRGLLENDLFIERFFARHEASLTARHAAGLNELMDLADNDLLDLLLRRKEPEGAIRTSDVSEVLEMLRTGSDFGDRPSALPSTD